MKIAILANNEHSFPRPMAQGLARMLARLGVQSRLFLGAWRIMNRSTGPKVGSPWQRCISYGKQQLKAKLWTRLLKQLRDFDVVVIVGHAPNAFMRGFFPDEELRQALPKTPIVLYDLVYLPTRGAWVSEALRGGNSTVGVPVGSHFGMERYDWYLCASVVSEVPMPPAPQPCSVIGIDLDDGSLYPNKHGDFIALLDFERPAHLTQRAIQQQALRDTKTPWIELKGTYSTTKIRELYRRCSVYFVAFRESFGLPICETQACGSYVVTPFADWCPSHWMKDNLRQPGPGQHSSNFIVYDNDLRTLTDLLVQLKKSYDPRTVCNTLFENQPELFRGNTTALSEFVSLVRSGNIHNRLHLQHATLQ
jgi:glycosyltransferase involved in cell wall biosynthesis